MIAIKKKAVYILAAMSFCISLNSCTVNKIHTGAFNDKGGFEDGTAQNYILLMDGTKVYGNKIFGKTGRFSRNIISIDGKPFKLADIRGYKIKSDYYGKMNYDFAKRIVKGKINIYVIKDVVETSTTTSTQMSANTTFHNTEKSSYVRSFQYIQIGDDGKLEPLPNLKAISKAVSSCPKASEMANQSTSQLKKAIRKDPNYMNSIFEIYNNECNSVGKTN